MATEGELTQPPDIRWSVETDSTNADLLALARAGAPAGTVVATDFQRAGRGRRGRHWIAPPRSALLASILVRPRLAPESAGRVTMAAALAAVDACRNVAGVTVGLKWPNDLVVGAGAGRHSKLAGLLAESLVAGERLEAVVVGMGCNLAPEAAAVEGATCLNELAGHPVDARSLLEAWLDHLAERTADLSGVAPVVAEYRQSCVTLGQRVRIELASEVLEGQAVDIDDDGHLLVDATGGRRVISVGDVVHLIPVSD